MGQTSRLAAPAGAAAPEAAARRRAACGDAGGSPCRLPRRQLPRSRRLRWRLQAVGDVRVLADQLEPGRLGLELEQRREILLTIAAADQALHDLVHQRGHRERDLAL